MTTQSLPTNRIEQQHQTFITKHTTTLVPALDEYYGDDIHIPPQTSSTRIYFQNINGARSYGKWETWHRSIRKLKKYHVNICGVAETNIEWNKKTKDTATSFIRRNFDSVKFTTSTSSDSGITDFQPGGTALIITDQWTGNITEDISDKSGIGRWTGYRIQGKQQKHISIFCGYRPTKSDGVHTCYQQQVNIYQAMGLTTPEPRQLWYEHMASMIQKQKDLGDEIILMLDANDTITNKSELNKFMQQTKLVSLIQPTMTAPATYFRGSSCIDFILGTHNINKIVTASGYLPIYDSIWPKDHRGLFIDIDIQSLLQTDKYHSPEKINRNLVSTNRTQVKKFIDEITKTKTIPNLLQQLTTLEQKNDWTTKDHSQFESIDQQFTAILLKAENRCKRPSNAPWSPQLHTAYLVYTYWRKAVSARVTNWDASITLNEISKKLSDEQLYQGNNQRTDSKQLRMARKTLQKLRKEASNNRTIHLHIAQETRQIAGKLNTAKAIKAIQMKEQRSKCFRMFKTKMKGQSAGGIKHILVQDNNVITRIQNKDAMDLALHSRNVRHFAQAEGTPFTITPLKELLKFGGCNEVAAEILQGKIPDIEIPPAAKLILQELKAIRPEMDDTIPFDDMVTGLKKWRESTTTSPSNKHLGIYKALISATMYDIDSTSETIDKTSKQLHIPNETAMTSLHIQHKLMNLAIKHCHTFQRWDTVHNFFLEKIPGKPLLEKLRVIHIFEADWNFILKYFTAHKLIKAAAKDKTISPEQAGGQPGRTSIEVATNTVLTYDTARILRINCAVVYNDAKACYDRVIECLSNLCCLAQGLPWSIAKLHAQTLEQRKYIIKHSQGIGKTPNGHMKPLPFHGVGQGATDAPARWSTISHCIISAYKKLATTALLISPMSNRNSNKQVQAFVDDANCFFTLLDNSQKTLTETVGHNTQLWENLLYATGGMLELTKCVYSALQWTFEPNGNPTLAQYDHQPIKIIDSKTKIPFALQHLPTNETYKLLGVHMALTGNQDDQAKALQQKFDKFTKVFQQLPLTGAEAMQGYQSIIIPALKYPLPCSSIDTITLRNMQKQFTTVLLPLLGYNRHMPREIVYATNCHGRLEIVNMPTEQGIAQINTIISHIRANTAVATTLYILIEAYQLVTGTTASPLIATGKINYIKSQWLDSVKQFLDHAKATITINNTTRINLIREHDRPIMQMATMYTNDIKLLETLNNCRIFLQVNTIAEITDNDSRILISAMTMADNNKPTVNQFSESIFKWPQQQSPDTKSWKQWNKFCVSMTKPGTNYQLKQLLGNWKHNHNKQRSWKYSTHGENVLVSMDNRTTIYTKTQTNRRMITYTKTSNIHHNKYRKNTIPLFPKQEENNYIIIETPRKTITCNSIENRKEIIHQPILNQPIDALIKSDNEPNISRIILSTSIGNRISDQLYGYDSTTPSKTRTTALAILETINSITPHWRNGPKQLKIFYDDITIATFMQWMNPNTPPSKRMSKEYSLLANIQTTVSRFKTIYLIPINKSHWNSDEHPFDLIHQPCNKTEFRNFTQHNSVINDAILHIGTVEITDNITTKIRQAISTPQTMQFYTKKYGWKPIIFHDIDWINHGTAIKNSNAPTKKFIRKMIHLWLPTLAHPSLGNIGSGTLCPCCKTTNETQNHLHECKHPLMLQMWATAMNELNQTLSKAPIDPNITKLIIIATRSWHDTKQPSKPEFLPQEYQRLFNRQSKIGWHHVSKGRLSIAWHQQQKKWNPITPDRWITFIITAVWTTIRKIWDYRNQQLHESEQAEQRKITMLQLEPKIRDLYHNSTKLGVFDRKHFERPIEEILQLPTTSIQQWIHKMKQKKTRSVDTSSGILSLFTTTTTTHPSNQNEYTLNHQHVESFIYLSERSEFERTFLFVMKRFPDCFRFCNPTVDISFTFIVNP